jgi:VWFA-related protein
VDIISQAIFDPLAFSRPRRHNRRVILSRRKLLASLPLLDRLAAQDRPVFSADVKLVNVLATVRDGDNRIVKDLTRDDFELFEDERRQTIRFFAAESNLPLRVGLVVDTSGSLLRRLADERDASRTFFRQVIRPEQDRAFLIRFDREIELVQDLTGSHKELSRATDQLRGPALFRPLRRPGLPPAHRAPPTGACGTGLSAIRDAVALGCDEVLRKQRGRKALILLSDGLDGGSCTPLRGVVEAAHRAEAIVYTLLFVDAGFERMARRQGVGTHPGKALMAQLAERTGGRMFLPGIDGSVAKAFAAIEEDLRNQYSIGYTPDEPSPGFHQIRLATKRNYAVQARDGYYGG